MHNEKFTNTDISKHISYYICAFVQQKDALVDAVFKKHKVTNEQYEQSLDWYAENIDVYNAMIDTISERLQREYNFYVEQAKEDYQHKLSGFTTELPEYFVIDNNNPTFRFRIDSLNIKMIQPENFKFSFDTNGVDTFFHQIDAAVYFKYRDTIVINKLKIEVDSLYSFTKPELPDSLLKEISGYVHLQKSDKIVSKILLKDISNKNPESMNKSDSTNVSNTDKLDFKDQKLVSK